MPKHGKKYQELAKKVDSTKLYSPKAAMTLAKELATANFDETVEVSPGEFFKNVSYTAVDSQAKALEEVKAGTADAAVVDSVMALGSVRPDSDFNDLTVNMDNNFGLQEYGIAFRKGSDTCAVVNAALAELYADGTVAAIAEKYGLSEALLK